MSDAQDVEGAAEDSVGIPDEEDVEVNVQAALREFLDTLDESETYQQFVAVAKALGEELATAKESSSEFVFTNLVMQCNEAIGDEIGIDYGSACAEDSC